MIYANSIGENDLSLNLYTEKGEIAQAIYANEAIQRYGTAKLSFTDPTTRTTTLLSLRNHPSRLGKYKFSGIKVYNDLSLICAVTGYGPDCQQALNQFNQILQNHCFTYGEPPNLKYFEHHLSEWLTRGLYEGSNTISRPLAADMTIIAYDRVKHHSRILEIENTGYSSEKEVVISGSLSVSHKNQLNAILKPNKNHVDSSLTHENIRINLINQCKQCIEVLTSSISEDDNINQMNNKDENQFYTINCCYMNKNGHIIQSEKGLNSLNQIEDVVPWLKSIYGM